MLPKAMPAKKLGAGSGAHCDILFTPAAGESHVVETDIIYWITGKGLLTPRTSMTVTGWKIVLNWHSTYIWLGLNIWPAVTGRPFCRLSQKA
ncbi:MAG: hypothetical protein V3R65_02300 [Acidiferrobacterales bacterium]